jgi:hypothetical protein
MSQPDSNTNNITTGSSINSAMITMISLLVWSFPDSGRLFSLPGPKSALIGHLHHCQLSFAERNSDSDGGFQPFACSGVVWDDFTNLGINFTPLEFYLLHVIIDNVTGK